MNKKIFYGIGSLTAIVAPVLAVVSCGSNRQVQYINASKSLNFDELIKFDGTIKTEEIKSAINDIVSGHAKDITYNEKTASLIGYEKGKDATADEIIESVITDLGKYYPNALSNAPKGYVDTGKIVWVKTEFPAPNENKLFAGYELPKAPDHTSFVASSDELYQENGESVWRPLQGWQMPMGLYGKDGKNQVTFKIKLRADLGYHIMDEQEQEIHFLVTPKTA